MSLRPLISKIIENMVHQAFLSENKILYRFQSGFRKTFSSDSCVPYLTNEIKTGFESGLYIGMMLIDVQKAFDTITKSLAIIWNS